jgi:hypothetical protein
VYVRKKIVKCYVWSKALLVLKLGHFGKEIRNTCKVLRSGAGEG